MTGYRAIIFDMDGVLVDSEPLFLGAINRLLEQEGVPLVSEKENEGFLIGTTIGETWRYLKANRALPLSASIYTSRYDEIVRQVMMEELAPQPGVRGPAGNLFSARAAQGGGLIITAPVGGLEAGSNWAGGGL